MLGAGGGAGANGASSDMESACGVRAGTGWAKRLGQGDREVMGKWGDYNWIRKGNWDWVPREGR